MSTKLLDRIVLTVAILALLLFIASKAHGDELPLDEQIWLDTCILTIHDMYEDRYHDALIEAAPRTKVMLFSEMLRGCVYMYVNGTYEYLEYLAFNYRTTGEVVPHIEPTEQAFQAIFGTTI